MDKGNVLLIYRATRFSPHSADRDAAILDSCASILLRQGLKVEKVPEEHFSDMAKRNSLSPAPTFILSMARSEEALRTLEEAGLQGSVVVNDPTALRTNNRVRLTALFDEAGITQPRSLLLSSEAPTPPAALPCWVKRGEGCAQEERDVVPCSTEEAYRQAMDEMKERGIRSVVVQTHLKGDLVKFYGVGNRMFFHSLVVTTCGCFSKFGLEVHNDDPQGYADAQAMATLHALADKAAALTGFSVYGGDAIVCADSTVAIIDFNDFPSFSPCRDEAAEAIVTYLLSVPLGKRP